MIVSSLKRYLPLSLGLAALIGCSQSSQPQTSGTSAESGQKVNAPITTAAGSEYVLTVEGMT